MNQTFKSKRIREWLILVQIATISMLCTIIFFRAQTTNPIFAVLPKRSFTHVESRYLSYYEPVASSTITVGPAGKEVSTNTINRDSLNERFDYSQDKPTDTYRIALLGDSFAFGLYVDTEANVSEQLEDMLNAKAICTEYKKYEVINFGVPAYDIEYAVERFRLRAAKYHPDMVMWLIEAGDFRQVSDIFQKHLQHYVLGKKPDKPFNFFGIPENVILPAWEKARADTSAEISAQDTFARENAALHALDQYFSKQLLIVSTPAIMLGDKDVIQALTTFAQSRKETNLFLDAAAPWKREYQVTDSDAHFSETGSIKIAESVYTYLHDNDLMSCKNGSN